MLQPLSMLPPMPSRSPRAFSDILPAAVVAFAMAAASVCAKPAAHTSSSPTFRLKVVRVYPHDSRAFTQGLLFLDGKLYESTGLYARSSVRRVDLTSGQVEQEAKLPAEFFGEGLARVGDRLVQLTWKDHKALVWDLSTLKKESEFSYEGEGWGLCFDGRHLVMSDGSDKLTWRNPTTFVKEGEVRVRLAGRPVSNLNELECASGVVYANVWQDSHIARIDASSGEVTAWIDASGLLDPSEAARADVLNGIAEMASTGHLLVTGKLWPHVYEVEVVYDAKGGGR
jgi:glutaminyl-peptide cyclotransferase